MSTGRVGHLGGWGNESITPTSCFSDDVWDPFYPFPSIQAEAMDGAGFEWKETAEAHSLTGRLRGVKKEEVKVEVEGGGRVLKISGKRSCAEEFLQRFRLPENVKAEEMKAAMEEDGVLTVTVPKGEVKVVQIVYC